MAEEILAFTEEQIRLIKNTLMDQSATDDDLLLFSQICKRLELDPFSRQIYAIKRKHYRDNKWIERWSFDISIDGFRSIAASTGECAGNESMWCGEDGKWQDVWLYDYPPTASKTLIYRRNSTKPFSAVARYKSYVQIKKDGTPTNIWQSMPDVMIAKCSEALALRKAFPRQLGGLYSKDEMMQADNPVISYESKSSPVISHNATQLQKNKFNALVKNLGISDDEIKNGLDIKGYASIDEIPSAQMQAWINKLVLREKEISREKEINYNNNEDFIDEDIEML